MFQKPDIADLRAAAQKLRMNPSDDYLRAVEQIVTPLATGPRFFGFNRKPTTSGDASTEPPGFAGPQEAAHG